MLIRLNTRWARLLMRVPFLAVYHARVGHDCSTYGRVTFRRPHG